jgi:hypothetical protein
VPASEAGCLTTEHKPRSGYLRCRNQDVALNLASGRIAGFQNVACAGCGREFPGLSIKDLGSYPGRFATHRDLKRELALLATSGKDWSDFSRRLAAAFHILIFSASVSSNDTRSAGGLRRTAWPL